MLKIENTFKLNFESINNADIGINKENEFLNEQNNNNINQIALQLEKIIFQLNNNSSGISKGIISELKNILLNLYKIINENNRVSLKIKNNFKKLRSMSM